MKNYSPIACQCLVFAGWLFSPLSLAEEGAVLPADGIGAESSVTGGNALQRTRTAANEFAPTSAMPLQSVAERNDPFRISQLMRQRAYLQSQGGAQFVAAPGAKAPAMILKGLVNKKLALLEIQGVGTYMVREGDSLSFNNSSNSMVIKIDRIDALSLNVKVGTLQEVVVVR